MVAVRSGAGFELVWNDDRLALRIEVDGDNVARLARLAPAPVPLAEDKGNGGPGGAVLARMPLVDIVTAGTGRDRSSRRYAESVTGRRLRYVAHEEHEETAWHELRVDLEDPSSGLQASVSYRVLVGHGVLRSSVRLRNGGASPITIESVTSLLAPGLAGPGGRLDDVDLWWAENEWLGEDRWHSRPFRDALPDLGLAAHGNTDPRGMFGLTSQGSWPSGAFVPMGAAVNRRTGHTWLWQVEHNGAWHWQVGEKPLRPAPRGGEGGSDGYLALLGPTYSEHHWQAVLGPGETFETAPAALAISAVSLEAATTALTHYRRTIRRPHDDLKRLPVIFNDYMNTLMGDPTTERLSPLIDAAAKAGAEYFVIDAGWYAGLGEAWWDTVGAWAPSESRFPGGIEEVLNHIRGRGMVPGLWLEPEVVGVKSPVAEQLPHAAFFCRDSQRLVENGRYQLDFTHPAAREHLDRVVDSLVGDLGVGYLKMDYNINIGPGTDSGGVSVGAGLLAHNRAFLEWVGGLLDRHKDLTIESCASGAMRKDYATLSRFQLQSTSDQQDFLLYPAISVAAPMSVAPEQSATWAYPQPGWDEDAICFAVCNALLGRVHLSGHLDKMSAYELQLVTDGIAVYKRIRDDLARAMPFWPLGLPRWDDNWLSLGMQRPGVSYIAAWHRRTGNGPGGRVSDPSRVTLPVPHLKNDEAVAELLYPSSGNARVEWLPDTGELVVTLERAPSSCLVALRRS